MTATITDKVAKATATHTHTVDIVGILGSSLGCVGFTGGTGWTTTIQKTLAWTYTQWA
jgi:hypothetical protein